MRAATEETYIDYDKPPKLFDITCTIGSVYQGGDENPHTLAFKMIGEHGADGHFTFPNEDGNTVHVTVETEQPKVEQY